MYNKNGKSSKLINILVGVIAVFIIIFLIVFLVNRSNDNKSVNNEQQFTENLNSLHETAKEFFAGQLPDEVGDSLQTTLQELIEMGAIDELKYGNDTCNTDESYISVTKTSKDEYRVKTNLVCGNKSDTTMEKIKSTTTVEDKDGNTIIDSEKDDVDLEIEKNPTSNGDSTSKNDSTVYCKDFKCTVSEIPTTCTVTYEYEYVKRTVSCPNGYNISGSTCVMESKDSQKPTPTYTDPTTKVVNAMVNKGKPYKVYADPIPNVTDGYYTCDEGTLVDDKCILSTNKTISYDSSCPYGYNRVGNYCYQYAPKSNGSTTSYCPTGYTDNGTNCYKKTNLSSTSETSCPSGYTQSGNYCYKYANKTSKTSTSCPSGTTPSNGKCVKKVSAIKSYSRWGNPVKTYSTSKKESTYTNTLEKKVLLGSTTIGKSTVYNYAIYKRTTHYTCAQGTLSGTKCLVYSNPISSNSVPTCPAGYSDNGYNCYIRKNVTTNTSTSCPSGYTKSGNYCYAYTNKITNTNPGSCPSGFTDSGSTCYKQISTTIDLIETCPAGYNDNGYNCTRKVNARFVNGTGYYSCPEGYDKSGTGENTICYKYETSDDEYYCENVNAELKGKLCYIKEEAKFKENVCPSGYTLGADNICYKSTQQTTNPTWTDVDYIFSKSTYVPGYQPTGRGKFHQICVRTDGSEEHKVWK